jgi:hypothetical protein
VTAWVRRHTRAILAGSVASVALGLASYLIDLTVLGYGPLRASEVFQPVIVVEAGGAVLAQYALGLWAAEHLSSHRLGQLRQSSDVSFGVFLAHPLLIAGFLDVAGSLGVSSVLGPLPSGLVEAMVIVGLVPFVSLVTFAGVALARRTRLSLALSGRRAPVSRLGRPGFALGRPGLAVLRRPAASVLSPPS